MCGMNVFNVGESETILENFHNSYGSILGVGRLKIKVKRSTYTFSLAQRGDVFPIRFSC